jgi:hypothetical protein
MARRYRFGLQVTLRELQSFYNLELEYASTDELRSMALHGHSALQIMASCSMRRSESIKLITRRLLQTSKLSTQILSKENLEPGQIDCYEGILMSI